ncbi:lysozyme family protein [Oceanobacillus piezotolerans]|uniref:Lysozyme family protein n=1 Tax=Oceanobacillus piezotolerans TaxID=2448030 RepID=A0A498D933_9BACI|nr:lysozyme family protein [Oceanobacillus piezotolerans]RLL42806.1 lysozyme family protein [Oceanobacillus piezotolerans]
MSKKKKKTKIAIYQSIVVGLLFVLLFVGISILSIVEEEEPENYPKVTNEVENYRSTVEKYAKEYGVSGHVDILLAMMMQESGGRGSDPMQSSESYCGEIGCIQDPELSIKQGVYYFSEVLNDANGDLKLAIQSYNFGRGFIDFVLEETGSYSQEIAIDFSQQMYENAPDKSIYTCLREEAKKYNACYGDIYYVNSVLDYSRTLAMQ